MSQWAALDAILRCPQSGEALSRSGQSLTPSTDGLPSYPLFDQVPWLLPNPDFALVDWQIKISTLYEHLSGEARQLALASTQPNAALTQSRLKRLAIGKNTFAQQILDVTEPLFQTPPDATLLKATLPDQAPRMQTVLSYEANIYRDWAWGEAENAKACELLLNVLPSQKPERLLMPGMGAGRLLYDLHMQVNPGCSVGVDINPFLLLSAARLFRGEHLPLYEFPREPISAEAVAIEHVLNGVAQVPENLYLVFANVLRAPFVAEAFDWIITPWLIDILPSTLPDTLRALNQYLPEGGYWINFGSLVFHHRDAALCFSIEEVLDLAGEYGFEIQRHSCETIPYLQSPHNAGYRMEQVHCWRAVKTKSVPPPATVQHLPPWLLDLNLPVPKSPALEKLSQYNTLSGEVIGWANGQLSLRKMAARLSKKHKIDKAQAQNTLIELYRQAFEQANTKRY